MQPFQGKATFAFVPGLDRPPPFPIAVQPWAQ